MQVYVSRLRGVLGGGLLLTRGRSYVFEVERGNVDADRFEDLVHTARSAREAGDARSAAADLRAALALWRGEPLADMRYESFAAAEIARLEELRLVALEERLDAELACGDGAQLVPELEALVREHPLRERLRASLMLALYRAGRQADALAAYRDARSDLDEELGVEPGPGLRELEHAILVHDPALTVRRSIAVRVRRRYAVVLAVGAALLAAAIAGVIVSLTRTTGSASLAAVPVNSVGEIDARTSALVAAVPVGARPGALAAAAGSLWVANVDDRTVSRIDVHTHELVRTIPAGAHPGDVAVLGRRVVLVTDSGRMLALDPQFDDARTFAQVRENPDYAGGADRGLAVGFGSLWTSSSIGRLSRFDRRGRLTAQIDVGSGARGVAVGFGSVWVANADEGTVSRVDPTNTVTATIPVGHGATGLAVGGGGVWVTNLLDGTLVRIDPTTNAVAATIPVGSAPDGVVVDSAGVWVAVSGAARVVRVDPRTNLVARTIYVGGSPTRLAASGSSVWVTVERPPAPVPSGGTLRIDLEQTPLTLDPPAAYADSHTIPLVYETCATLVNHPDESGPAGVRLVPEVAASMPAISADGKTYTFTIRPGYRFSPPSNEPVTAKTFAYSLERALDPRSHAQLTSLLADVVGVKAFAAGRAPHVSGIVADGRTLRIRLVAPAGDFLARLAIGAFCPVPLDTPIDAKGVQLIPSAGPYYLASNTPGTQLVLRRNPNYHGPRPRRPDAIVLQGGISLATALAQLQAGTADYAGDGVPTTADRRLRARFGEGSAASRSGHQRYFTAKGLNVRYLMLNPERPLFADARVRRAVNFAIDRRALADALDRSLFHEAFAGGGVTTQYLPPEMPGRSVTPLYPLRPDLKRARLLLGAPRTRSGVMFACNYTPCRLVAAIVQRNLAAIGIDLRVEYMPTALMFARAYAPHARYDIFLLGWVADFPDPADFLQIFFNRFHDPGYVRGRAAAERLTGPKRFRVFASLARRLALDAAPAVAYESDENRVFFSARVGCQIFQPIYGVDLGALCLRR